ncbi:hypothetical protein U9M48_020377 [Paspalum notatum var. saurae]|uniref:DUF4371 domain-containing protein n=1 Tax=Paspalum notatum var. saurae TaxID=547442 RepID=A0AAQ3TE67_PASNO
MKRKTWGTPDLRSFLARAAVKKNQSGQESVAAPSSNERELQMVIYQEGTSNVPPEPERAVPEPPIVEDEDSSDTKSVHLNEIESSNEEDEDDIYGIEHDSGLRLPISSYDVNDQDSVRRAYIALGPFRPKMKIVDFPQHECGGEPVERFLGLVKVEDTTSLILKEAIQSLLIKYQLPLSKIRGQGYDGASNIKGHVNGLKKLVMEESPSAYYIHCFAHQLQLTLVAVAKENIDCAWFFGQLAYLLHVLGMSRKKISMLRVAQAEYMIEALKLGEIELGQGLNQEMGLARPGDTRWGSHYRTVMHVMALYPSIKKVLSKIGKEYKASESLGAQTMLQVFKSFEFVFILHLMNEIFGYTNDLYNALQRREQNIVNAKDLLEFTNVELDVLRNYGWGEFLQNVTAFCEKYKVEVVDMNGKYVPMQRDKNFYKNAINYHRFHADMFLGVIDRQLVELNNRFDEPKV